jgi:hypothetical protein
MHGENTFHQSEMTSKKRTIPNIGEIIIDQLPETIAGTIRAAILPFKRDFAMGYAENLLSFYPGSRN